jgi:hypothetical protein
MDRVMETAGHRGHGLKQTVRRENWSHASLTVPRGPEAPDVDPRMQTS